MARKARLKTDKKPVDRIEHAHEKQFQSDYEDLSTATLCVREVNISDGVLTGGLCGEAHKLQANAHYFVCSKHRHPTDRWESFPNTRIGWETTESRIRSAIEFRTFKLRGMNEALKLANERVLAFAPNSSEKVLHSPQSVL
jgi:hypothetical protein